MLASSLHLLSWVSSRELSYLCRNFLSISCRIVRKLRWYRVMSRVELYFKVWIFIEGHLTRNLDLLFLLLFTLPYKPEDTVKGKNLDLETRLKEGCKEFSLALDEDLLRWDERKWNWSFDSRLFALKVVPWVPLLHGCLFHEPSTSFFYFVAARIFIQLAMSCQQASL